MTSKGGTLDDVNHMLIWIAVHGLAPDKALAALNLELPEGGEAHDVPGWPDFLNRKDYHDRIFMGRLPGNWLLLFGNLDEEEKDLLARLAKFGPAYAGDISRIGSYAEGRSYEDGREIWSVAYDLEGHGPDELLKVHGHLPAHLAAIVDEARAAEAEGRGSDIGVDVLFEVPGSLSKAMCGFSPHEKPPEGFRWSMLQRIGGEPEPKPKPKANGFLALLFGRR